ncbi:uncharacterized protein LOC109798171 [Cajanus cajan]|uniref:Uncharacterized protein n=1 Tax=Cajanus cajan TaxID=3821 RepID=A0A151TT73_CAJCA|nr:uncharacterized protein LOC109798171 [Cajanus cajan]KYP70272.1 hypothetical protein KK1_009484 [Cajanus cajan]
MSVVLLHPRDSLTNDSPNHFQTMKLSNPKTHRFRNRKKRTDFGPQEASTKPETSKKPLGMGQVKILKRGEQLTKTTPDPQPQMKAAGSTEKVEGLYAGYSLLVVSPSPSSVPLPAFITKKIAAVSDATTDLRKMLRLDFS